MTLSKQLNTITLFTLIGLTILGVFSLQSLKSNLIDSSKNEINTILNLAKAQASFYIKQEKNNEITREEAEAKVIEVLTNMRCDASYIWANDNNAISRVHPKKEQLGTFQSSYATFMGKLSNQDIVFSVGQFPKPGSNIEITKINGAVKIPEWNWVMGIGVYMDDVDDVFWSFALEFIIVSFIILGLIVGGLGFVAFYYTSNTALLFAVLFFAILCFDIWVFLKVKRFFKKISKKMLHYSKKKYSQIVDNNIIDIPYE